MSILSFPSWLNSADADNWQGTHQSRNMFYSVKLSFAVGVEELDAIGDRT